MCILAGALCSEGKRELKGKGGRGEREGDVSLTMLHCSTKGNLFTF